MLLKNFAGILSLFSAYNISDYKSVEIFENNVEEIPAETRADTWKLVFSDDFSGTSLDTSKWEYQAGCSETYGRGNLHCYVAGTSNTVVKDGLLVITSKIEDIEDKHFTTGRIRQKGDGILYGKFVFRARLSAGKNLWPALWLKSKLNTCYNEIDILETKGEEPTRLIFTAHYGLNTTYLKRKGAANRTSTDYSKDFHIYEMQWTYESLAWYVDDILFYNVTLDPAIWKDPNNPACPGQPFNQPESIIINQAVGGGMFSFAPLSPEEANQNWTKTAFEVDYVRVYQLK